MSKIHWSSPVDGNFDTAADWSTGSVPGTSARVFLDALGGTPYTVTASMSETVRAVRTAPTTTLAITGGVFVIRNRIDNRGTIALDGASLEMPGFTTLSGGGNIVLGGTKTSVLGETGPGVASLTNVNNTISGAGRIGGPGFFFENQVAGVVNATGARALTLEHIVGGANAGLIEATGSGGLTMKRTFINMEAFETGVILAGAGSAVRLSRSAIDGGTLRSAGSGTFIVKGSVHAGVRSGAAKLTDMNNQAAIHVARGFLDIGEKIHNAGAIGVTRAASGLAVGIDGVTLSGGGSITLRRGNAIVGDARMPTLTNIDNTISGAGLIGGAALRRHGLKLNNRAQGVIDADRSGRLTLDTGAHTIVNAGTLEATGVGRGEVRSAVDNTGTLETSGGGALRFNKAVTGDGSAIIRGGTLAFKGVFAEDVAFTGGAGALELGRSRGYAGAISGFSKTGGTVLDLRDIGFTGSGEASFSGDATSGVLTISDGTHTAHLTLIGDYTGQHFVASSDSRGGTNIIDSGSGAPSPHRLVAAMAGMAGAGAGVAGVAREAWREPWRPLLATPGHARFA
ncbi:MAG: hypothetical protein ABI906_05440 [Pseudomonadota bacterium]